MKLMIKNSPFWRTLYSAWQLVCDYPWPISWRPVDGEHGSQAFNALYALPIIGAAGGLLAIVLGAFLSWVLPLNGAAIIFALILTALGEMRTSARALALNVTTFEQLFAGKSIAEARQLRSFTLSSASGVVPLLLAVGLLGGKFFAILLAARTGHFGIAGAAWVAALSAEGVMASEQHAMNVPQICREAKGEYIIAVGGFFLLFNLIALPLATLVAVLLAAVITISVLNLCLKRTGKITSNDITLTGYLLELAVWGVFAILIG